MSVRQFGTSWWVDFTFRGARHRLRSPANSRRDAANYETILRSRLALGEPITGTPPKPSAATFAEFSQEWFSTYVRTNNRPSEQQSKESILRRHLVPWFGATPMDKIQGDLIERYKQAKLEGALQAKTINNQLSVLQKCLRVARSWGRLAAVPEIVWLKAESKRIDYLTVEECRALVADSQEPMWRDVIYLALYTGLRRGELMALDWSDVHLEHHILTVRQSLVRGILGPTKNNKVRHVQLAPYARAMLIARRPSKGFVFCQPDGRPLTKSMMAHAMRRICRRVGIRQVSWHVLRHSTASFLAWKDNGSDIIKDHLGHSSLSMTQRYTHLSPSVMAKAAESLQSIIG